MLHSQLGTQGLPKPMTGSNVFFFFFFFFFWDGMKKDIRNFVAKCDVCQCNKGETVKSHGTLQPLLIPPSIWQNISTDFIVGLPK
jgi:hypothetical protein